MGSCVARIRGAGEEALSLEELDLSSDCRRLDLETLGQLAEPDVVALGVELVEQGRSAPIEVDPGIPAQGAVRLGLVHRTSDSQERCRDALIFELGDECRGRVFGSST
jgi:hypothetical protein